MESKTPLRAPAFPSRGWGVADVLYGVAIVAAFARWVPWRTPVCNVVALVYGLAHVLLAPFILVPSLARPLGERGARALWRASFAMSIVGVLLGLLALAGLLFSWAYLRASFGAFGAGASVVCLLLAVVVANVCGLYPALRMGALWRARAQQGAAEAAASTRLVPLVILFLGLPTAGFGAAALDVSVRMRARPLAPWSKAEATRLLSALTRGEAVAGSAVPGVGAQAAAQPEDWRLSALTGGERVWSARQRGSFSELPAALSGQRQRATTFPSPAFWLLERVADRTMLPGQASPWLTLGLVPGLDGAEGRVSHAGFSAVDAVAGARFGVAPILPALREVRLGLDAAWAMALLPSREPWMRVRYETWVLPAPSPSPAPLPPASPPASPPPAPSAEPSRVADAWPVVGGRVVRSFPLTRAELVEGARRAGEYLVRMQIADGRFRYRVDLRTATATDPFDENGYDLPRHAGTTLALATWAERQHERPGGPAGAAAVRAADWMLAQRPAGGFLAWGPEEAHVGENALALVAFLATARAVTGARGRLESEARELALRLQSLVRPDGTVITRFDPATRQPHQAPRPMFEAEEAAYALIASARQLDAPELGLTGRRILDELLHKRDGYFLGWFSYGADAWTCLAVEAGWPEYVPSDGLDHCRGYASFLRRLQDDGRGPFPDRLGQYGFSEILVPQTPAAAGFSEAVLATWALARRLGVEDEDLAQQGRRGLTALLREETRAETAFLSREPAFVDGGFTRSSVEPEIRVDFVQHALSALLWGALLVGESPGA